MSIKTAASQIPIIGGLFDDSDQQAIDQMKANQALYDGLQTPTFQKYSPEAYQVAGQYDPTMMDAKTISEDPSLRNTQMNVLNKMAGLADNGLSDVDQAGFLKARELGDQMARSGEQAAEQNAVSRGMAGSGMEFAMRDAASQDGAQRAQDAAVNQAADSARQRAMYTQMMGGQDFNANAANTDIMNRFNQLNTQNANQAQQYNLQNNQSVYNQNVQNRNSAQQYNNDLQQRQYQDQLSKVNGQAGANQGVAQTYAAQNAANNDSRNKYTQVGMDALGLGA